MVMTRIVMMMIDHRGDINMTMMHDDVEDDHVAGFFVNIVG